MAGRRRSDRDDEGYHSDYDARRRHQSQPPKNRLPGRIEEEPSQRPKLVTRDDSYYDPRDVYYLSDAEGPEEHPWFAQQREDEDLHLRERHSRSPSSRRPNHSQDSPQKYRKSSRGHSRHSRDRRPAPDGRHRSRSKERHRLQRDEDERESRHARRSDSREAKDYRRSKTVAPSRDQSRSRPASPLDSRRGTHRDSRDHKYPPSARRSDRVRSSTQPAKARARSRSSSLSPIDQIKEHKDALMSAAKAMLQTGAMAAVKMHGEEGDWIGMKGAKVLSTALSGAAVDTFMERKKPHMNGGMRHSAMKQAAQVALVNLVAKPAVKKTKLGK